MAKFTVPKAGYDFTIPQGLPAQPEVRTAMFRQMGELTTGGDEFALIDGGLALHCVGGHCRKKDRRGKAVNPNGSLGLVVLSGDKAEICKRLHALLTGEIEVAADEPAQVTQPIQPEWQDEIIPHEGYPHITFWGERLPDALQGVALKGLESYFVKVLADVIVAGKIRADDRPNALRRLGTGLMPLAFVLLVSHPEYKRKFVPYERFFISDDETYRLPWNDYVDRAIALISPEPSEIPVAESTSRTVERVTRDAWPPPLPQDLQGVNASGLYPLGDMLDALRCLGPSMSPPIRMFTEKNFRDPLYALHAVYYIDRNPEKFKPYKNIILPRWDAWVKTAQAALRMGRGILR